MNQRSLNLPPRAAVDLKTASLLDHWRARAAQHTHDSYAGVPLSKFPEDLRVYEHLLWQAAPDTVIEVGTQYGASALWFRDRLRTLAGYGRIREPRVVTVDIDQTLATETLQGIDTDGITFVEGDVRDIATVQSVQEAVGEAARCLVVEDSAHVYETTMAVLRGFARFVPVGGFLVVEDGCVDVEELRIDPSWPRGVLPAIGDWLATHEGRRFKVCQLDLYGITCHPGGFLRRCC